MAKGIVLNIDTTKSEFQNPMIELRQGDGNYQSLDVTVTSNGSPFNLTGWTITFMGTTAGGFKIVDTSVSNVDTANGKFTYTPPKAWGQDEGMFKEAYFKFTSGDNGNSVASGASLRVNVLTAVDLTEEEAGNYISVVDVMIDKVKTDMDNKLKDTQVTLNATQTQAHTVQGNVDALNTNVNDLKAQNNNIRTADNEWTGVNTFDQKIVGSLKTRRATFSDYAVIAKSMDQYTGKWFVMDETIANGPQPQQHWYYVEVSQAFGTNTGTIEVNSTWGDKFITGIDGGEIKGWYKVAKDSTVVHNTGTETVAGDKNFTGNDTFTQPINGSLNGNASSATKLKTPRTINGTNFDGTDDINVNAANDSNLVHIAGNETIDDDKTFTGNVSVTGSLDAKQKIYTRTINPVAGVSIIYKRVGNIVSGRFNADLSGDFQLNNNDGYKSPSEYPVNVIVGTGSDAWFTQDNKFHTNAVSHGNFIFITNDQFPTN